MRKPKRWIKDATKRKQLVDRVIREKRKRLKIPKTKDKAKQHKRYARATLKKFIEKTLKGTLVTDKKFDKLKQDEEVDIRRIYPESEARILYEQRQTNWYERFEVVSDKKVLRKYEKIDPESGERKIYKRWRTERRFRDTDTGRLIAYSERSKFLYKFFGYVPDKNNPRMDEALKAFRETDLSRKIDVRGERSRMRKEYAILKIAERKQMSIGDARELYEELADETYERYLLKEYAGTPE